jgi:hypothetical protein
VDLRVPREEWLRLIEERYRNALVANMIASALGPRAQQTAQDAVVTAEQYMTRIREPARRAAASAIAAGDWASYANVLTSFLDILAPVRVSPRRGRPPATPRPEVRASLSRYDEIRLQLQSGQSREGVIKEQRGRLRAEHAPDFSCEEVKRLLGLSTYWLAAELAVRGTRVKAKTLIYGYAPRQKAGRLHTIANELGMWTRSGKRRRSYRFTEGPSPDLEELPHSD